MFIEDVLPRRSIFEFKPTADKKLGVYESFRKEGVTIEVGCVAVCESGTAARRYVAARKTSQELREVERTLNPVKKFDDSRSKNLFTKCLNAITR